MTDQQVIINPDNATDDIPGIDASLFSFWKCITVSISEHMQYRPKSGNHFLLPGRNLPGPMSLSRKLASAGQQKKQCYPKVLRFLVHVAAVVNGMGDKGAKLRYYLGDIATIADEEDDCQYLWTPQSCTRDTDLYRIAEQWFNVQSQEVGQELVDTGDGTSRDTVGNAAPDEVDRQQARMKELLDSKYVTRLPLYLLALLRPLFGNNLTQPLNDDRVNVRPPNKDRRTLDDMDEVMVLPVDQLEKDGVIDQSVIVSCQMAAKVGTPIANHFVEKGYEETAMRTLQVLTGDDGDNKQRVEKWILVPVPGITFVAYVYDVFGQHEYGKKYYDAERSKEHHKEEISARHFDVIKMIGDRMTLSPLSAFEAKSNSVIGATDAIDLERKYGPLADAAKIAQHLRHSRTKALHLFHERICEQFDYDEKDNLVKPMVSNSIYDFLGHKNHKCYNF